LLQFFGIMLGLPTFMYLTLYWAQWRVTGQFGPNNELPQTPTYYALIWMDVIVCGCGLAAIAPNPRRNYLLPVPSWMLALSKMLPTAICAAAFYVVSACVLNLSFDAGWPLLGPALFIAVTSCALLAVVWFEQRTPFRATLGGLLAAGLLAFWFHSRHGGNWGEAPEHVWNTVTPLDAVCLGVALLVAFVAGTAALHFNRHEDVPSPWLVQPLAWTGRLTTRNFRSREMAQFWFEWRHRTFAIPLLTMVISVSIPIVFTWGTMYHKGWAWNTQDASDMIEGQIMFAMLSPIWNGMGIGVLVGIINPKPSDRTLGPFRGTLPVSDRWMAMQLLRSGLSGLLASSAIALVVAGLVALIVQSVFGREATQSVWAHMRGDGRGIAMAFALLLLGWAILGAILSAALGGRIWMSLLPAYACAVVGLYGAGVAPYVSQETTQIMALMFGVALIYGWASCGYSAALAKGFLNWRDVGVAAAVWLAGTILVLIIASFDPSPKPLYIVGNLLITAAVAPWATAPLALAWNRHR
ncbi:MAG TPA: hypothetical protein VHB77_17480, partial [Planctomycetaceae bacterium]|nr:hypothetical protein [Planctomycetaceae bacterium]